MYASTRGGVSGLSFEEALRSGYCSDGGLVVPDISSIPSLDTTTLRTRWAKLSYPGVVKNIIAMFIPEREILRDSLNKLVDNAFSRFTSPSVVNIARLGGGLNVVELYHGPTMSFKDLAMSCVGQLLDHFLTANSTHSTILVGTSGDTGSSAIEAVRGMAHADVIVLLPRDRCTPIQELQMTTAVADNVHVFRVDGNSDELDEPIRECFNDKTFVKEHQLMSLNSINWVRILVQTAHYIYVYLQICPDCNKEVEIVVPTGAAGNVAAGCIARRMGLPIRLVCSVNSNEAVARAIQTGTYSINGPVQQTLATAMDIQAAYNMERLLWLFSDGNTSLVRQMQEELEKNSSVKIPDNILSKMREAIKVESVSDDVILKTMYRCWEENNYLICPHTATAVHYHYKRNQEDSVEVARACLATASPSKFPEAVQKAGINLPESGLLDTLKKLQTRYTDMNRGDNWLEILRNRIEVISQKRKPASK